MHKQELINLIASHQRKNDWGAFLTLYNVPWGRKGVYYPENAYEIRFYPNEKPELKSFIALFTLHDLTFKTNTNEDDYSVIILSDITNE